MEHGPLDFKELRVDRGLMEAGPTRTGHKTRGLRHAAHRRHPDAVRANAWMIQQRCPPACTHPAVQRRKPGSGEADDRGLALPVRSARGRAGAGDAGQRLAGLRVAHVGVTAEGGHAHRRALAAEPGWQSLFGLKIETPRRRERRSSVRYRGSRSRNGARAITASTSWTPAPIRAAETPRRRWRRSAPCPQRDQGAGVNSSTPE